MRQFRKDRKRVFGFESLECRWTMAGNVSVSLGLGNLSIVGDSAANALEVRGTLTPGEVLITPQIDEATGQQTTVNGSSSPLLLTGLTGNAGIVLFQGNDEIYIKDLVVPGNMNLAGDQGRDTLRLGNWVAYGQPGTGDVTIGGMLRIDEQLETSAADGDEIFLGRVTVGQMNIRGRQGNDFIEIYNARINNTVTGDWAVIDGGEHNDVLNIAYFTVHGDIQLYGDQVTTGNDLISVITSVVHGKAYVDVWQGSNTVALNANQFLGVLEIYSEQGTDSITLTNSFCSQKVVMSSFYSASNGNDTFLVTGNTMSDLLRIVAGSGYDNVTVQSNQIVKLYISAGSESDVVAVRYNIFYGHADILGGSGYDLLYFSGNLFLSTYALYEFEAQYA